MNTIWNGIKRVADAIWTPAWMGEGGQIYGAKFGPSEPTKTQWFMYRTYALLLVICAIGAIAGEVYLHRVGIL